MDCPCCTHRHQQPRAGVRIATRHVASVGASWRELGFGPGHRTWRVLTLGSVPQIVALGVALLSGQARLWTLAGVFIPNGFKTVPWKSSSSGGALQTRPSLLLGSGWGPCPKFARFWEMAHRYQRPRRDQRRHHQRRLCGRRRALRSPGNSSALWSSSFRSRRTCTAPALGSLKLKAFSGHWQYSGYTRSELSTSARRF